ncbi:unnamed protein product [Ilex paraguariensis]|uniref:Translocation protein SEC62 n=1 Tax=Ilex paraguariensis TaxID=185542 RepID=A0ABC8UQW4_9AQUA
MGCYFQGSVVVEALQLVLGTLSWQWVIMGGGGGYGSAVGVGQSGFAAGGYGNGLKFLGFMLWLWQCGWCWHGGFAVGGGGSWNLCALRQGRSGCSRATVCGGPGGDMQGVGLAIETRGGQSDLEPKLFGVRALIFGAIWIIIGKRVWFFPNILAEEATLQELFRFWPQKDEEERPKWTARLFYAIVAVLVILILRHHAPDEAARARYQKRVSNIIDDVLEWSPRLALSGMMEKQQTVVNATEPIENFTEGSETSSDKVVPPYNMDGEAVSEQQEEDEEVIGNVEDTLSS